MVFRINIVAVEIVEKVSDSGYILKLDTIGFTHVPVVGCEICWGIKDDSNIFALSNWSYYFLTWRKLWKNKFGGGGDGEQELSLVHDKFEMSINFFFLISLYLFIYLLIFGCVGSSFLCEGFL